jgi:putative endonuclease
VTQQRRALGAHGEDLAAQWYLDRGYTVLDRNWWCSFGEIDVVAARPGVVVFCEVKTRTTAAFGSGAEAVTRAKQVRLRRLAAEWLATVPHRPGVVRFDVAAVHGGVDVEVVEAAF